VIYSASKAAIVIKQWLLYCAQNKDYAQPWQADDDYETCVVTKFIQENKWAMVRLCLIYF